MTATHDPLRLQPGPETESLRTPNSPRFARYDDRHARSVTTVTYCLHPRVPTHPPHPFLPSGSLSSWPWIVGRVFCVCAVLQRLPPLVVAQEAREARAEPDANRLRTIRGLCPRPCPPPRVPLPPYCNGIAVFVMCNHTVRAGSLIILDKTDRHTETKAHTGGPPKQRPPDRGFVESPHKRAQTNPRGKRTVSKTKP
jgi:hypothetical protein